MRFLANIPIVAALLFAGNGQSSTSDDEQWNSPADSASTIPGPRWMALIQPTSET